MNKKSLILIGGGDHCASCIDVIEQQDIYNIFGILDIKEKIGQDILGYPIIATDDEIFNLNKDNYSFFITIGQVMSAKRRIQKYSFLKEIMAEIPTIISPKAYVSKHAFIGEGTIIFPFSVIDVNVRIGNNCIINHHNTIGHDAIIEDNCHISANCVIGKCKIGEATFIGGNSWVTNAITIASYSVIGSASNVIKNIETSGIYAGNPAKFIRYYE